MYPLDTQRVDHELLQSTFYLLQSFKPCTKFNSSRNKQGLNRMLELTQNELVMKAFPGFDNEALFNELLIKLGGNFLDTSYHHDELPSIMSKGDGVVIWVNYANNPLSIDTILVCTETTEQGFEDVGQAVAYTLSLNGRK